MLAFANVSVSVAEASKGESFASIREAWYAVFDEGVTPNLDDFFIRDLRVKAL